MSKTGVQLYSLRSYMTKDNFGHTMEKLAATGCQGVEFAGLPKGMSWEEAAKTVRNSGMEIISAHLELPLGPNKNQPIEIMQALGVKHLISYKGPEEFKTRELIKKACDDFNEASAELKKHGFTLAHHNHWYEFEMVGDTPAYKIMMEYLDKDILWEIDVYWVTVGGQKPGEILKELGARVPFIHIKDGAGGKVTKKMTAAGKGVIDFKPIFPNAKNAQWLISELDDCETDMLQAIQESCVFINKNK